jgi:hypothetical protein
MKDSILASAAPEVMIKLYNLTCEDNSFIVSPCFFASRANSLAESNSAASSPILK